MQLLGNFTNVFMGKYHLTKPKNNTCQQQQYLAISPENKHFSRKYPPRFSRCIYRNSASLANRLLQSQKPYWRRTITLNFSVVTRERITAEWLPDHSRSAAGQRAHRLPALRGTAPEEEDLAVPFRFDTPRYFWRGKPLLLPKKILHLFLSIQISVIWSFNSNLGHSPPPPPKRSIFVRFGNS